MSFARVVRAQGDGMIDIRYLGIKDAWGIGTVGLVVRVPGMGMRLGEIS